MDQTSDYVSFFLSLKDFIATQWDKMGDLRQVSRAPNLCDVFPSLIFNLWLPLPAVLFICLRFSPYLTFKVYHDFHHLHRTFKNYQKNLIYHFFAF